VTPKQLAQFAGLIALLGLAPGMGGCWTIFTSKPKPVAKAAPKKASAYERKESERLYHKGLEAYLANKYGTAELLWRDSLEHNPYNEKSLAALKKVKSERKALQEVRDRQNSK